MRKHSKLSMMFLALAVMSLLAFYVTPNALASSKELKTVKDSDGVIHIVAYGDTRSEQTETTYQVNHKKVVKGIFANIKKMDLVLFSGDSIYIGADNTRWEDFYGVIDAFRIENIPIYPVLGNHEHYTFVYDQNNKDSWSIFNVRYLYAPGDRFPHLNSLQNIQEKKAYYSFTVESEGQPPVLIVSLDTTVNNYDDPVQLAWFKDTVTNHKYGPIIAFTHYSPYTSGKHCNDSEVFGFRDKYEALFDMVDIWFTGHDHDFERIAKTAPVQGKPMPTPVYIIAGGGGANPRDPGTGCKQPKPDQSWDSLYRPQFNFGDVTFEEGVLIVTTWGTADLDNSFEIIEQFQVDWKGNERQIKGQK